MKRFFSVFTLLVFLSVPANAQDTVHVNAGWNIIGSIKAGAVPDVLTTEPFGIITTAFFSYDPEIGYQSTDTLDRGLGYWIKVSTDGIVILTPSIIVQDTVNVKAGWNLVGALSNGPIAENLSTEPPGIITSSFYGYAPGAGYQGTDTLSRGLGYWMKVSADGIIIWNSTSVPESCGTQQVNYGGITYNTVKIGNQCWLAKNLNVGSMVTERTEQSNNSILEKYCYNNDEANCTTYGGLYQWEEAMQYIEGPGSQGICPPGWHIPTYAQFQMLSSSVGGDGNALKAVGQGAGDGAGTNTSGFSALLAGYGGFYDFGFYGLGYRANFWSSEESGVVNVYSLYLYHNISDISFPLIAAYGSRGFSVRCLED